MDHGAEALIAELARVLELDHQFVADVPAWDVEHVRLLRACGRAAAARLGWKVRTSAARPVNGYTRVTIFVVESTPEDEARFRQRLLDLARHELGDG